LLAHIKFKALYVLIEIDGCDFDGESCRCKAPYLHFIVNIKKSSFFFCFFFKFSSKQIEKAFEVKIRTPQALKYGS